MDSENLQQYLDLCFSRLYSRFSKLVGRFGGEKLEQNLKNIFLKQAKRRGMNVGEVSIDWADYRSLTDELIKFTAGVAGKKQVQNEVRTLVSEIEQDSDASLYEIWFKLGIHEYLEGK